MYASVEGVLKAIEAANGAITVGEARLGGSPVGKKKANGRVRGERGRKRVKSLWE